MSKIKRAAECRGPFFMATAKNLLLVIGYLSFLEITNNKSPITILFVYNAGTQFKSIEKGGNRSHESSNGESYGAA
jgi:hypothetical protein